MTLQTDAFHVPLAGVEPPFAQGVARTGSQVSTREAPGGRHRGDQRHLRCPSEAAGSGWRGSPTFRDCMQQRRQLDWACLARTRLSQAPAVRLLRKGRLAAPVGRPAAGAPSTMSCLKLGKRNSGSDTGIAPPKKFDSFLGAFANRRQVGRPRRVPLRAGLPAQRGHIACPLPLLAEEQLPGRGPELRRICRRRSERPEARRAGRTGREARVRRSFPSPRARRSEAGVAASGLSSAAPRRCLAGRARRRTTSLRRPPLTRCEGSRPAQCSLRPAHRKWSWGLPGVQRARRPRAARASG